MKLATFGAVMRFAIEREAEAERRYLAAAGAGVAPDYLEALARSRRKRRQALERARQENVAEMILESIHDLDGDDFAVTPSALDAPPAKVLGSLADFEAATARFHDVAAEKVGLAEVARQLTRLAKDSRGEADSLRALSAR